SYLITYQEATEYQSRLAEAQRAVINRNRTSEALRLLMWRWIQDLQKIENRACKKWMSKEGELDEDLMDIENEASAIGDEIHKVADNNW
ncbi:hypothetical protein LCGC14_1532610, partial [marine sediment metagenome]